MSPIVFFFLAGLVSLGFLVLAIRRRRMPALLRGLLIIGASAIVVFVAWTLFALLSAGPASPQ